MGGNLLLYTSCKLLHVRVVIKRNETYYCEIYRSAGTDRAPPVVCCQLLAVIMMCISKNPMYDSAFHCIPHTYILLIQPCCTLLMTKITFLTIVMFVAPFYKIRMKFHVNKDTVVQLHWFSILAVFTNLLRSLLVLHIIPLLLLKYSKQRVV
jgi:hypothetical protein